MNRFTRLGIFVLAGMAFVAFAAYRFVGSEDKPAVQYRTAPVKRGDLLATIGATGTVEPEELVDVGAQVAGQILAFGKDGSGKTIDYGSVVEEGMVLARIDDSLFAADVATAKAQLEQARAGLLKAQADLGQLQAKLVQAERDWHRAKKLGPSDALSQADFDAAQSAYEVARANVEVGKAAITQSKSAVSQSEATLRRAQRNFDYCTIRSPVDGVIIDRRVNIGQTVVASLSAPSLFLIAKNLKRMQVWVSVNEADIGSVYPGQPVAFTVDAYPGKVFQGEVGKVRLNASMTQNVVTYIVEVITDNSDGKLLPYLTANARFMVSEHDDVLMVPNAALRWSPTPDRVAPDVRRKSGERSAARDSSDGGASGEAGKEPSARGVVYLPDRKYVRPLTVTTGMTDGSMTEIQGEGLKEGMLVVLGEETRDGSGPQTVASPFTPQFFGRGGGRSRLH